jgi:hypothetical protein
VEDGGLYGAVFRATMAAAGAMDVLMAAALFRIARRKPTIPAHHCEHHSTAHNAHHHHH